MKTINIIPIVAQPTAISYSFNNTRFGRVLIASTEKGICYIAFADDESAALVELQQHFPDVILGSMQQENVFDESVSLTLHLKGTPYQLAIWKKLLEIPEGTVVSYTELAGDVRYARAAGTAVAANPVAFLIPCHRVVKANGEIGNYHWGAERKAAIIQWERKN